MKVSRQNLTESYNTTVDWVNDFSNGLTKESDYLDNLKNILDKRKEFSTIEEKMADIRSRAGFDLIKNIPSEDMVEKQASCCNSCDAGSGSCSACDCGKMSCSNCKGRMVKKVLSVLEHLRQRQDHLSKEVGDEKSTNSIDSIIAYCRNPANGLGFSDIESVISINDLKRIMAKGLGISKNFQEEVVPYIPEECESSDADDNMADYFSHALTSG